MLEDVRVYQLPSDIFFWRVFTTQRHWIGRIGRSREAQVIILFGLEALYRKVSRAQLFTDLSLCRLLAVIGSFFSVQAIGRYNLLKCCHSPSLAQSSYVMSLFTTLFHISRTVLAIFAYDRYLSEGGHTHSQMALISRQGVSYNRSRLFFYRNAQLTSQGATFLPTSLKNLKVKIKCPKEINSLTIIIASDVLPDPKVFASQDPDP